jgi:hypothetical protein
MSRFLELHCSCFLFYLGLQDGRTCSPARIGRGPPVMAVADPNVKNRLICLMPYAFLSTPAAKWKVLEKERGPRIQGANLPWSAVAAREQVLRAGLEGLGTRSEPGIYRHSS